MGAAGGPRTTRIKLQHPYGWLRRSPRGLPAHRGPRLARTQKWEQVRTDQYTGPFAGVHKGVVLDKRLADSCCVIKRCREDVLARESRPREVYRDLYAPYRGYPRLHHRAG